MPDWLQEWVDVLGDLDSSQETMLIGGMFAFPLLMYFLFAMVGLTMTTRFVIISCIVAVEALVYSFKVLAWLMKLDSGTPEMQEIADTIVEGSEGYFKA